MAVVGAGPLAGSSRHQTRAALIRQQVLLQAALSRRAVEVSLPRHSRNNTVLPTQALENGTLSSRNVAVVGGLSWFGWYLLRLVLRDVCRAAHVSTQKVMELHALSSIHAFGWVVFLINKLRGPREELSANCSRGLAVSLGFYLHDIWVLRGTLLRNPSMLAHQATMALTIFSILRSKAVSWLAPFMMSQSVPTLLQEMLLLCGTLRLPPTRPEVRSLRFLWFTSFVASKLALVPMWLRNRKEPELQQPTLLVGKLSYLFNFALNFQFIARAAHDLPRFLRPQGTKVPTRTAYAVPLAGAKGAATYLAASTTLVTVFGSYLSAPAAFVLSVIALFRSGACPAPIRHCLRFLAAASVLGIGLDQILPMAKECDSTARWWLPMIRQLTAAHRHRFYPEKDVTTIFKKDRHYLLAVTPHGFFPWGVAAIIVELLSQGYLPNFVGASVLGSLPVAGRLLRYYGYKPATAEAIRECLGKEYPRNVTIIVPGGISEMFKIREDVEVSCANTRLGFVKLAKEQGVMLVPGYMLGNSQLYQVAKGFLGQLFETLSRRLKTSITLFHGRWGTLLPYPQKLACALGEPIDTRLCASPEEAHRKWLKGLVEAYDNHKEEFGWAGRRLFFEGEVLPVRPEDPLEAYTTLPKLSKL